MPDLSAGELKRLLTMGQANPAEISLTGEVWEKFCFAKFEEKVYNKFCFCRSCFSSFTMHDSKGNSYFNLFKLNCKAKSPASHL